MQMNAVLGLKTDILERAAPIRGQHAIRNFEPVHENSTDREWDGDDEEECKGTKIDSDGTLEARVACDKQATKSRYQECPKTQNEQDQGDNKVSGDEDFTREQGTFQIGAGNAWGAGAWMP